MDLLLRSRRGLAALTLCACALLSGSAARALPIAIDEQQRSVAADAAASNAAANDADADADSTLLPGAASLDAAASAAVLDSSSTAFAGQQSDVGAALVAGSGNAVSASDALGSDAYTLASAESRFRIVFTATADASLRLTGLLGASGHAPGDATALVELSALDASLDSLLLLFEVGPDETLPIDAAAPLKAGVAYRLIAVARANTDALDGETGAAFSADYSFALTEVPEPGAAFSLALGLALLAKFRSPLPA
jgi:hypothetical protein